MGVFNQNTGDIENATHLHPESQFWKEWVMPHIFRAPLQQCDKVKLQIENDTLGVHNDNIPFEFLNSMGIKKFLPSIKKIQFFDSVCLSGEYTHHVSFNTEQISSIQADVIHLTHLDLIKDVSLSGRILSCHSTKCLKNMDLTGVKDIGVYISLTKFVNCRFDPDTKIQCELPAMERYITYNKGIDIQQDTYKQLADSLEVATEVHSRAFKYAHKYSIYDLFGITDKISKIHISFGIEHKRVHLIFTPSTYSDTQYCTKDGWSVKLIA